MKQGIQVERTAGRPGFTLIELLIVVAIIAILAAIAVPNFLEAQTRSKVSRVKADMRTIATGVQSYLVDNNRLFRTYRQSAAETREWICRHLTTPVAYLTSYPKDPFNKVDPLPGNRVIVLWGPDYIVGGVTLNDVTLPGGAVQPITIPDVSARSAVFFSPYPLYSNGTQLLRKNFWVLFSLGPDQKYAVLDPTFPSPLTPYDPTNGTVSKGDVVRFQM